MKLHYAEVLNPRKVCALAKYLDAPITYIRVDLGRGEHFKPPFRAINPNGKVPVLEDGDTILWEADAILCHLARRAGSDLWPSDDAQVEVMRWLSWNQVHFQPLGGVFYFERVIKAKFNVGAPDEAKLAATDKPYKRFAHVLNAHLEDRAYLLGDRLSIADFSLGALLPYRAEAVLPLDECPSILRWHERLKQLRGWNDPFPAHAEAA